jgi:hypothetical protein
MAKTSRIKPGSVAMSRDQRPLIPPAIHKAIPSGDKIPVAVITGRATKSSAKPIVRGIRRGKNRSY